MAKKKKNKFKVSFFGEKNSRGKKKKNDNHIALDGVFKADGMIAVIIAVGVGFVLLDKFIIFNKRATLTLVNPPKWATEELDKGGCVERILPLRLSDEGWGKLTELHEFQYMDFPTRPKRSDYDRLFRSLVVLPRRRKAGWD